MTQSLYGLLDGLEDLGLEQLNAEIATLERRLSWCRVLKALLEKEGLTCSAAESMEEPKPQQHLTAAQVIWNYIDKHGPTRPIDVSEKTGLKYGTVQSAIQNSDQLTTLNRRICIVGRA